MKLYKAISLLLTVLLSGCAVGGNSAINSVELSKEDSLINVQQSAFDHMLVQENYQHEAFKRIFIEELDLSKAKIAGAYRKHGTNKKGWALTAEEIAAMQGVYMKHMVDELENHQFLEVVRERQDADLVIDAHITRMSPSAPKDDFESRDIRVDYYSRGSGTMSISIDVKDNETTVMALEDKRNAGAFWEENTRWSNEQNVKRLFNSWARDFATVL